MTGDLARRKLFPAIEALAQQGALPERCTIVGTTRQLDQSSDALLSLVEDPVFVRDHLELFSLDVENAADYARLAARLSEIEAAQGEAAERLFYLSVPPTGAHRVIAELGRSGLAQMPHTKLLMEKPFGVDLASATALEAHIAEHFTDAQMYHVDHYLEKGIAREVETIARDTVSHATRLTIDASESIGIENRARFYEQTGALRDMVQSHLLELVALLLMDRDPATPQLARRLAALKQLEVVESSVRRGQYIGYRDEVDNQASMVETYVELTLTSRDPRLAHLPIVLTTGKKLDKKETRVTIASADGTESIYHDSPARSAEAYERIILAALRGDRDRFVSRGEVLESWRILARVQEAWRASRDDLFFYEPGSDPRTE